MKKFDKESYIGLTKKMNCGMFCTIIKYRNSKDIDVQFTDGNIIKHRNYYCFLNGKILNNNLPHNWSNTENIIGKKFNRWKVLQFDKNNNNMSYWLCQCDCGTIKSVAGRDLRNGNSKSCGCLKKELLSERCRNNTKTDKLKNKYPELIKYLFDKNDAELTLATTKSIECICPLCKEHRTYKGMKNFIQYGFTCPNCSSKISYPNKFVYKFLTQLNINFETEKVFDWSNKKRYDFYIPALSCIIEAHGLQHYKNSLWTSLEYQQNNDNFKENIALSNGIKFYIQLDCRKSNCNYIKQSILNNNKMNELFNLSKIDWEIIDKELKEV